MLRWRGTFWPHIMRRPEVWVFTFVHLGLVVWQHYTATPLPSTINCPCLTDYPPEIEKNLAGADGALTVKVDGNQYKYPSGYGLAECGVYDAGVEPYCATFDQDLDFYGQYEDLPDWCDNSWCYVDPSSCNVETVTSVYLEDFANRTVPLQFSYEACGEEDTFTDEGDGTAWIIEWSTLGLSTTLCNFFLVFFLGQCYARFQNFFKLCLQIETSVHETAIVCLTHIAHDVDARWDVVRYLTASALIVYFRVGKVAEFKDAMVDVSEFERLLTDERAWLQVDEGGWEKLMGWPRTRAEAAEYTALLHRMFGLSAEQPSRKSHLPALLTKSEAEALRAYPGGMMSFVLQTWALQRAKATGEVKPPWFNALQGCVYKLRQAAYTVRAELNLPVPMPYFHAVAVLQTVNFVYYSYAMLEYNSYLTPFVLWIYISITVGMREVAATLANPFGDDDVDFPVHKWITQLRGIAIAVHPLNNPIGLPPIVAPTAAAPVLTAASAVPASSKPVPAAPTAASAQPSQQPQHERLFDRANTPASGRVSSTSLPAGSIPPPKVIL